MAADKGNDFTIYKKVDSSWEKSYNEEIGTDVSIRINYADGYIPTYLVLYPTASAENTRIYRIRSDGSIYLIDLCSYTIQGGWGEYFRGGYMSYAIIEDKRVNTVLELQTHSRAEMKADIDWDYNRLLEIFDDSDDLLFRGKLSKEIGWGADRVYKFDGLDKKDLDAPVTLIYTTATGVHTIAKAAIDYIGRYINYDVTSIPDPSVTTKVNWEEKPLRDCLMELADLIDGLWYVVPGGKLWLLKIGSIVDAVNDKTQATGDCSSPTYELTQRIFNYIHLYGSGYLESITQDAGSIILNGILELIQSYSGIDDQTELDAIGASLKDRKGIANAPIEIIFMIRSQDYLQPGNYMGFQWTHISRLATNTDYVIKKVIFRDTGLAWVVLTNSTFQEGREYIT